MSTNIVTNWTDYKYFKRSEFACKHSGQCQMDQEFMARLCLLRDLVARPIIINSGYRHWTHPIEAKKGHRNGEHVQGRCADIRVSNSAERFEIVDAALQLGFTRVGIAEGFVHVGLGAKGLPNNVIWLY